MPVDFVHLPDLAMERLGRMAREVSGVTPVSIRNFKFSTSELSLSAPPSGLLMELRDFAVKGRLYLYYLQAYGAPEFERIRNSYLVVREKGDRAVARYNSPSPTLYVGSSADLTKRIKEHLGFGAKATYALHLAHWAQVFSLELELVVASYPSSTTSDMLQTLEDTLWEILKPMFGRRGSR